MSMPCPYCACKMSSVRNTQAVVWRGKEYVRRYRVCRHCKMTFATREEVVEDVAPVPPKLGKLPQNPYL